MTADTDGDGAQALISGSTTIGSDRTLRRVTAMEHGDSLHVGELVVGKDTLMHAPPYRMQVTFEHSSYNQPPHTGFHIGNGGESPETGHPCEVAEDAEGASPHTDVDGPSTYDIRCLSTHGRRSVL